jgi:hypothetical protein
MLGTAEWRAGEPDAIAHLEQALAGAGEDHGTVIATAMVLAPAYRVFDRAERAVEVFERALTASLDVVADAQAHHTTLLCALGAGQICPLRDRLRRASASVPCDSAPCERSLCQ